ncbi:hypothetical protein [Paraburkholderia solisilvae]|uniref:hypothetical protein n=1 Tax=Paraburkholderia solisilvae TaxID=624376 RepID=UPI0015831949|nr:hypothetical protein [Paraburkholderia solisilvae]
MVTLAELKQQYADQPAAITHPDTGPSRSMRRTHARSERTAKADRFFRIIGVGPGSRFRRRLAVARIIKRTNIERRMPVVADLRPIIMSFNVMRRAEAWIAMRRELTPADDSNDASLSFIVPPPSLPAPPPPASAPTPYILPIRQRFFTALSRKAVARFA